MYSSTGTEEEREQLFNARMNNVRDKEDKRPTNGVEKMKLKIKPMTF